jgi:hypothetical protein
MCTFGAPKEIISDQGRELVNLVVSALLSNAGVMHRITSGYNPRANGHTERLNRTSVQVLRKLSADAPAEWPKWLPFTLLAIRLKIHRSTNFSPYELLFGVKMPGFQEGASRQTGTDRLCKPCSRAPPIVIVQRDGDAGFGESRPSSSGGSKPEIQNYATAGGNLGLRKDPAKVQDDGQMVRPLQDCS